MPPHNLRNDYQSAIRSYPFQGATSASGSVGCKLTFVYSRSIMMTLPHILIPQNTHTREGQRMKSATQIEIGDALPLSPERTARTMDCPAQSSSELIVVGRGKATNPVSARRKKSARNRSEPNLPTRRSEEYFDDANEDDEEQQGPCRWSHSSSHGDSSPLQRRSSFGERRHHEDGTVVHVSCLDIFTLLTNFVMLVGLFFLCRSMLLCWNLHNGIIEAIGRTS